MTDRVHRYSNGEIAIIWQPSLCAHSGVCARGLPGVFRPRERPWIVMEEASTSELIAQVDRCPSGALSWERLKDGEPDADRNES